MSMPATITTPVTTPLEAADGRQIVQHSPGVYFGLPEQAYHDDPALGSSDTRRVAKTPSDYWWTSWMNPLRPPDKETPARLRGSAVHAMVLYGTEEFERRYMRGAEYDPDMSPAEKGAATKAANAKAAKLGLTALNADVHDNIVIAAAMIAKNPKLKNALTGGANEVSIFWVSADGVPKKARTDCLKVATPKVLGIGDLKSITNKYDKPFDRCCIDSVVHYRYDIQARHYMDGCSMIPQFVADGCVYGDHDPVMLKKIAATTVHAWQWVWWQAEGAPITYSRILSPGNPLLEVAAAMIARADNNYLDYLERFGATMWLLQEEPKELFLEDMPPWFARD